MKQHKGCGGATPPCCYNVYSTSVEGTASTCCARYRSRGECRLIGQQEFNPELLGHKIYSKILDKNNKFYYRQGYIVWVQSRGEDLYLQGFGKPSHTSTYSWNTLETLFKVHHSTHSYSQLEDSRKQQVGQKRKGKKYYTRVEASRSSQTDLACVFFLLIQCSSSFSPGCLELALELSSQSASSGWQRVKSATLKVLEIPMSLGRSIT